MSNKPNHLRLVHSRPLRLVRPLQINIKDLNLKRTGIPGLVTIVEGYIANRKAEIIVETRHSGKKEYRIELPNPQGPSTKYGEIIVEKDSITVQPLQNSGNEKLDLLIESAQRLYSDFRIYLIGIRVLNSKGNLRSVNWFYSL